MLPPVTYAVHHLEALALLVGEGGRLFGDIMTCCLVHTGFCETWQATKSKDRHQGAAHWNYLGNPCSRALEPACLHGLFDKGRLERGAAMQAHLDESHCEAEG